jgi:hypothetical protein
MRLKYLPYAIFVGALSILLSSYSAGYTNGSGGDNRTGSIGAVGCGGGGCHSSAATTGITVTLELDSAGIVVTRYRGGGSYTVKITGTNTTSNSLPDFGFGISTVLSANANTSTAAQAGSWGTAPAGTQISVSNTGLLIAEHQAPNGATSGSGGANTVYSESIPWTAPVAGSGSVKIYGVLNAVNGNNQADNSDKWNATSITVTESSPNGINDLTDKLTGLSVYPTLMNSNVTIAFDLKETSGVTVDMVSLEGQVVKTLVANESLSDGAFRRSYDINGLATGIYLVRVQIGSSFSVTKVIKD